MDALFSRIVCFIKLFHAKAGWIQSFSKKVELLDTQTSHVQFDDCSFPDPFVSAILQSDFSNVSQIPLNHAMGAVVILYEHCLRWVNTSTGSTDNSYALLGGIYNTPMVTPTERPEQSLARFQKILVDECSDVTPRPEDLAQGLARHESLSDASLVHRLSLEIRNVLNGSSIKTDYKMAYDALKGIYDCLEEDNIRVAKDNSRQITFQDAINKFNDVAHNFSEMREVPIDQDPKEHNSIAQSLALFSYNSGGQGGGTGRGSGRSNQGKYNSRSTSSGEQGKGKPKRPDKPSRQETQRFKELHSKDPSVRAYMNRDKPGNHEEISDLIKNVMYLYAVLLQISTSPGIHDTCRLDSETLGRMFEWISLSVSVQKLSKLTEEVKKQARDTVQIPTDANK